MADIDVTKGNGLAGAVPKATGRHQPDRFMTGENRAAIGGLCPVAMRQLHHHETLGDTLLTLPQQSLSSDEIRLVEPHEAIDAGCQG